MEELNAKQCVSLLEAIQALTSASDLLCGTFRTTQYAEMMSEISNRCNDMVEDLEWVVENEIEEQDNPHLINNTVA